MLHIFYKNNDHILFQEYTFRVCFFYYTLDNQLLLSSCLTTKTDLSFLCNIIPFPVIINRYCIMENFSEENKKNMHYKS